MTGARRRSSRKRRKANSEDGDGASSLTGGVSESQPELSPSRDAEFWLEDGNIVLVAGNIAFRVYRGLLAKQSPVFYDLFSSANTHADEHLDGAPVVRLFDSPEDLRHLLRVIIPTNQSHAMKDLYDLKTEFCVVSALIRLAHKYQIEDIEHRATKALAAIYSTNLDAFTQYDSSIEADHYPFAISAVNLARLTGKTSILPSALYHCCVLQRRLLSGFTREDGTVEHLSSEDLGRCMRGVEQLTAHSAKTMSKLGSHRHNSARCIGIHGRCEPVVKSISALMRGMLGDGVASVEALGGHLILTDRPMCEECIVDFEEIDRVCRNDVWRKLPNIFDLEDVIDSWPANDVNMGLP